MIETKAWGGGFFFHPVLVYGLGKSGRAVARLLQSRGVQVFVYDDHRNADSVDDLPVRFLSGALADISAHGIRWIVASPGISPLRPELSSLIRAGFPVLSELEVAWMCAESPCIIVTGTNGKSSAVHMIACLLQSAGLRVEVVGNVGVPFSSVLGQSSTHPDWYIVEASSFQLALSTRIHAPVLVYTNYSVDHVDWHGSEDAYIEAKVSIAARQRCSDTTIVPLHCGELTKRLLDGPGRILTLGGSGSGASVELSSATGRGFFRGSEFDFDLLLSDTVYEWRTVSSALHAALGVALALDIDFESVLAGAHDFRPLEHRLEIVGRVDGVQFVNDSKATNVDSVNYALRVITGRPIVLILGGRYKGCDFRELLPLDRKGVVAVVAFGEAHSIIIDELSHHVSVYPEEGFEQALEQSVRLASAIAEDGESRNSTITVLFSPGCSSYDMFSNFEERGRVFKQWVSERAGFS